MQTKKQAVLLIHGVGEQRPMETLRRFVHAVWTTDKTLHKPYSGSDGYWSKPYDLSDDFELRRLTTPENRNGIRTDFYELYWAHLMQGTRVSHVFAWARALLFRWPWKVPGHLQLVYWLLLALLASGAWFLYAATMTNSALLPAWQSAAVSMILLPLMAWVLIHVVGDAARYLHVAPANVKTRRDIRTMGVKVLHALHKDRRYDRIIIVGHSLGSVIGFDILHHAWASYNEDTEKTPAVETDALDNLEAITRSVLDRPGEHDNASTQKAQHAYFDELVANQSRWRVTDFITLGSPLAHADVLLANDHEDLLEKLNARELPRCLPALETSHHAEPKRMFSYPMDAKQRIPHHGAVFGPTRWTNLYFPSWLLVRGDLIGGKLQPVFGESIKDVPVHTSRRFGFLSHMLYWRPGRRANDHIKALRAALNLLDL